MIPPMMVRARTMALVAALGVLCALLTPGAAHAGTATVSQCEGRGGASDLMAPDLTPGWLAVTGCDGQGAAVTSRWPKAANVKLNEQRTITFRAPGETTFTRASIRRFLRDYLFSQAEDEEWSSYGLGYRLTDDRGRELERCGATGYLGLGEGDACSTDSAKNSTLLRAPSFEGRNQNAKSYTIAFGCFASGACLHWFDTPGIEGISANFDVEDVGHPVVDATGPLVGGSIITSTSEAVTLRAADPGGLGILSARAFVDNSLIAETRWEGAPASCVDQDPGAGYSYAAGQPCSTHPPSLAWKLPPTTDGAHTLDLRAVDAAGNETSAFLSAVTIDRLPPVLSADPTISGTPRSGSTLQCSIRGVDAQDPAQALQWSRARADGSGAEEIPGATGAAYTLTPADQGSKVLCRVTVTDRGGSSSRTSSIAGGPFADGAVVTGGPGGASSAGGGTADGGGGPGASLAGTSGFLTLGQPAASSTGPAGVGSVQGPSTPAAPGCPVGTLVTLEGPTRLVARRAKSAVTVRGAVRGASGTAAPGIAVELVQRVRRPNTAPQVLASGASAADGRFALKAPVGASRDLQVIARSCAASGPVVRQTVRGVVVLKALDPRVRNGQLVRFSGRAAGGYYGKGVGLELQVLVGRQWRDVKAVKTDRSGRFKTSYRFKRTYVRYTYQFRMVSRAGASWPFTPTRSAIARVRVN